MFELGLRLAAAAFLFALSSASGLPPALVGWSAAAGIALCAVIRQRLEDMGKLNGGYAGLLAVLDSFIVAVLLGSVGALGSFGFLVLLPVIDANRRFASNPASMAPISAGSLFASYAFFTNNAEPRTIVLVQAAAVMATGLTLGVMRKEVVVEAPESTYDFRHAFNDDAVLEMRESYRNLRKAYQDLEKRTKKPVRIFELEEVRHNSKREFHQALADKIGALSGADGVGLYSVAQFDDAMVVRGVSGSVGAKLATSCLTVKVSSALSFIRNQTHLALQALRDDRTDEKVANVLLVDGGRAIGMVSLVSNDEKRLESARATVDELAPAVASLMVEHGRRESMQRRAQQAEVLYETACVTQGASTPLALADRVSQQLYEITGADHVSFTMLDGEEATTLTYKGAALKILDALSLPTGSGARGWKLGGWPGLSIFDARTDSRVDSDKSLRLRIGSIGVAPVSDEFGVVGCLCMATHHSGGVDALSFEALQTVAAELGRAFTRMRKGESVSEGLMPATEFHRFVERKTDGCLVLLEALKTDELEATYGGPALAYALRQLANRVRAKLPTGGALCRKPDGSFVAFLPIGDEEIASRWANDAATTASLIGLTTPDGSTRIPLGLRAKVAKLDRQESEILLLEAS